MKNLTKIFIAVVVAMAAFACASDPTKDLGVELGNGADGANGGASGKGETVISLSIEEARTHISTAVGNKYPMYWSETDKISVNGVEATETLLNEDKTIATFTIPSENLGDTWRIAYPATADNQVKFEKEQTHTEGTFGNNVTTMYAQCPANEAVTLNHLTAVLKLGLKGSATLDRVQVSTIDRAPIAGAFDIDFETGAVTPTGTATPIITYSFGDNGLQLTEAAQDIHVVVPAGEYKELYLTLFEKGTSGKVMYATVKATKDDPTTEDKVEKPLNAGQMRSFGELEYKANGALFVIDSTDKLAEFKDMIEDETAPLATDAVLVADIEAPENWEPINGVNYTNTLYGNGYAINGLTAPLFGTTSASFKGLHLMGVAIEETTTPNVGAFARKVTYTDLVSPTIENCSAKGTITVKYEGEVITDLAYGIGGLIGNLYGAQVSNCTNNVIIDVQQIAKEGDTTSKSTMVGGVVGHAVNYTEHQVVIDNCTNNATICYSDASNTADISVTGSAVKNLKIGGVVGDANADAEQEESSILSNLTNTKNGTITLKERLLNYAYIGGVVGEQYGSSITACKNYAKINKESGTTYNTVIGGVAGVLQSGGMTQCHNYGVLELNKSAQIRETRIGGVIGIQKAPMSNCTNNEAINQYGSMFTRVNAFASVRPCLVGGIVGQGVSTIEQCTNNEGGAITVTGTIFDGYADNNDVAFGGIAGRSFLEVKNSTNHAAITFDTTFKYASHASKGIEIDNARLNIGGCVGYTHAACSGLTNNGNISLSGSYCGKFFFGGVIGHCTAGLSSSTNNGAIIFNETGKTTTFANDLTYVGGIAGCTKGDVSGCTNSSIATITINEGFSFTGTGDLLLGGGIGDPVNSTVSNSSNAGNITIAGAFSNRPVIGGFTGYSSAELSSCSNSGKITVKNGATAESVTTFDGQVYIGGFAGIIKDTTTSCSNSGALSIAGTYNAKACIAGNTAWVNTGTVTSCSNSDSGDITIESGAIFAKLVQAEGATLLNYANPLIAGGIAYYQGGTSTDIDNDGAITIKSNAQPNGYAIIGGCIAYANKAVDNCENTGAVTIESGVSFGTNTHIAGGVSYAVGAVRNITNRGAISIGGGNKQRFFVAGCLCQSTSNSTDITNIYNLNNYGTLTATGSMTTSSGACSLCGVAYDLDGAASKLYNHSSATITMNLAASASNANAAGIVNSIAGELDTAQNDAAITVNGKVGNTLYIAGILANCTGYHAKSNLTNNGNLTMSATGPVTLFMAGIAGNGGNASSWTNCHNHGELEVGSAATVTNKTSIGGVIAKINGSNNHLTYLDDCSNDRSITIDGDIASTSQLVVGGVVGHHQNEDIIIKGSGITNSGDVTVAVNAIGEYAILVGGVIGWNNRPNSHEGDNGIETWTGNVKNSGTITVNRNVARTVLVGGLFGRSHYPVISSGVLENTGDITCSGQMDSTDTSYIGGIIGELYTDDNFPVATVDNARCWCTVTAWDYSNVGMVTGSARVADKAVATNCYVGGYIDKGVYKADQNQSTGEYETKWWPNQVKMGKSNYWKYVYGTRPSENDAESISIITGDGCGFITAIDDAEPEQPELQ